MQTDVQRDREEGSMEGWFREERVIGAVTFPPEQNSEERKI